MRFGPIHISLFLLLFTLGAYWGVQNYPFIELDDTEAIVKNYHLHKGITGEGVKWAFTTTRCYSYWMPLTWISFLFDYQLYALEAGGYHLTNLIFHMVNGVLLFLVLYRLSNRLWLSAIIGFLLALHPVHLESVAWVSSRKDVLSMFFWLLTTYNYISFVRKRTILRYLVVIGCFVGGLLAKPICVTLPFALLLLDIWLLNRLVIDKNNSILPILCKKP